jgi:hypothetical protein
MSRVIRDEDKRVRRLVVYLSIEELRKDMRAAELGLSAAEAA